MKSSKQQVAVILREDVEHLGFSGELVKVKPGYARNLLLPRKLAELATPALIKQRTSTIAKAEKRRQTEIAERQELASKIAAVPIKLTLKVGPGGQVFGAVTAAEVVKALATQRSVTVTTRQLNGLPLKHLGRQEVSVKLGLGVVAQATLAIAGQAAKQPTRPRTKKVTA